MATDGPWITSGRTPEWEDGHDWRLLTFEKTYCPEPTTYDEELYCPELYCPEPTTHDTTSINTLSEGAFTDGTDREFNQAHLGLTRE